jgi:phage FluMu gp28-like protein
MPNITSVKHFLPYQLAWIRSDAPAALAEKSRRIGWTYASAYRAVFRRLTLGTDLFYSSADLGAAREFVGYCERFARAFNETARDAGEQVIDERDGVTALVLRFANGARIVAGSSNPKFFRSKGGDADADEFAFHADQRGLFKAMHATAMVWGHQLRAWSTHNGEGAFFNRLCQAGSPVDCGLPVASAAEPRISDCGLGKGNSRAGFPVHRVTILDAVEQGLVERIKGLDAPNLVARREWLEELRASCPDEDTWREEYLCEPGTGQAALLSYDLITACEAAEPLRADDHVVGVPIRNPQSEVRNPLYAGFDVGRKRDRSVLWVLERVGDVYHTRRVREMEDTPFSEQEDVLHVLLRDPRVARLCVDATGIGAMLAERLRQRWGHRVEGVHFTPATKSELAMPLVRLFQDRLVRIPRDPAIREDLHKVRKTITSAGNVRLDAPRDDAGHADRFWALALAHHAADHAPARLFTLARKPAGW